MTKFFVAAALAISSFVAVSAAEAATKAPHLYCTEGKRGPAPFWSFASFEDNPCYRPWTESYACKSKGQFQEVVGNGNGGWNVLLHQCRK